MPAKTLSLSLSLTPKPHNKYSQANTQQMAEDSHVIPLAPPQIYKRSDEEWAKPKDDHIHHKQRNKKSGKCFVYIFILLVLQSIAFLVFGLVVLRIDPPKLKLGLVRINDLNYSTKTTTSYSTSSLNVTILAEVVIDNKNFGRFKLNKGSTSVVYDNTTLGMTDIKTGLVVKGRKKNWMNVTVQAIGDNDNGLAGNRNFSSDIGLGLVTLSSYAHVRGEVRVLKYLTRHRTSFMNCTMNLNLTSRAVQNLRCM
ncbi:hypothetical protein ACH5RR_041650 [Cinchona calisaya]|uniref:Late embryogenesis abundant protein LEA-2 subgroup domain-containing protein n=1 Tax=Cinchona calisaya TaxID=153742 RepID=A0ABD2XZK0_9GENT